MIRGIRGYVVRSVRAFGFDRLSRHLPKLLSDTQDSVSGDGFSAADIFGHFRDSQGKEHPLIIGLRDRIKPKWRTMFQTLETGERLVSVAAAAKSVDTWSRRVSKVERLLSMYSATLKGKTVVEIGAFAGATSFALARAGAARVIGTDIASYYIRQTPGGVVSGNSVTAKSQELKNLQDVLRRAVGEEIRGRVSFLEDNICSSSLESESTEVIVSWEVLEHLIDPSQAFEEMFRVLKPGGIAFHEYNPFFSQDGGHSLCTLDFPWGHARLSSGDFKRYLREVRPSEQEVAGRFYFENLNRMTTADLRDYAVDAGFTVLSIVPWIEHRHFDELPLDVLADTKYLYPSCELTDLISPTVWVLLRKEVRPREPLSSY